jgi:putative glutamine amidotransferase
MNGSKKSQPGSAVRPRKGRPLIGVTKPKDGGKTLWLFTRLAVRMAKGEARCLIPGEPVGLEKYDGFIIAGGGDINPELYGEAAVGKGLQYDLERDALEQEVIRHAAENKKPLLGICRGMQMMNVTLGGSLYQEAKEVLEDFLPSKNLLSKFIGRRVVSIDTKSALFKILGDYTSYNVNSIHHQAVNEVGEGFTVVGREKNGLVQAIEQIDRDQHPFMIGVQWHPELMLHVNSARQLFKALVDAAR